MRAPNLQTRSGWLCTFLITVCMPDAAAVWGPSLMLADPKYTEKQEMENLLKDVQASRPDVQPVLSSELIAALQQEPRPAIVIIPEMEKTNWLTDRTQFDVLVLAGHLLTYMQAGGRLLVVGVSMILERHDLEMLNHPLFGLSLQGGPYYTTGMSAALNSTEAAGTAFESAPATLEAANAVMCVKASSLPPGAKVMYKDSSDLVWAFTFEMHGGMIIWLAHDWHEPSKSWFGVLNAALWTFPDGAVTDTKTTTATTLTATTITATSTTSTASTSTATTLTATTSTTTTFTTTTTTLTTTTSTATSATQTSTTDTVTTFTDVPLVCTPDRMFCPVPQAYHGATYEILGSEASPACQRQGRPDAPYYFEFPVTDCNTSRTVDTLRQEVVRVATLVPVEKVGAIIFIKDKLMPILLCTCRSPQRGEGSNFASTDDPQRPEIIIGGSGEFKPTLTFFTDKSFASPLGQSDLFPLSNERILVQVDSAAPDDVIGLENCVTAPSAALADPYTAVMLQGSCPAGEFDFEWLPAIGNNSKRFSVLNFRFGGKDLLYMTCIVVRCLSSPCGVCADGGRRLSDGGRRMQDESWFGERAMLTTWMVAPVNARILPAPVDNENMVLVWEAPDVDGEAEAAFQADLNIYGYSEEFNAEFASAVENGIDGMLGDGTKSKVLSVSGVPLPESRRLSSVREVSGLPLPESRRLSQAQGGVREVLTARVAFVGVDAGEIVMTLSQWVHGGPRTGEFVQRLREEFDALGLGGMADAVASFELVSPSKGTPVKVGSPPETGGTGGDNGGDKGGSEVTMDLGVLVGAVAGAVALVLFAAGVCLVVGVSKRRRSDRAALMAAKKVDNTEMQASAVLPTAQSIEVEPKKPPEQGPSHAPPNTRVVVSI